MNKLPADERCRWRWLWRCALSQWSAPLASRTASTSTRHRSARTWSKAPVSGCAVTSPTGIRSRSTGRSTASRCRTPVDDGKTELICVSRGLIVTATRALCAASPPTWRPASLYAVPPPGSTFSVSTMLPLFVLLARLIYTSLFTKLMGQCCFARWCLSASSSSVVCNAAHMQRNSPGGSTRRASRVTSR